ncbi:hypothetical protein H4582DRAFT_1977568 [Lactarius indigo]|nr:hypothetical protein H4582DRAFT_1977568 [Lactarius indigo]
MSVSPFSAAHRRYVKSLYKRMLENERNWVVRYDFWRARACAVRAEFERNRNVHDPRALAAILEKAEEELARKRHPDPYIRASSHLGSVPSLTTKRTTNIRKSDVSCVVISTCKDFFVPSYRDWSALSSHLQSGGLIHVDIMFSLLYRSGTKRKKKPLTLDGYHK